MLRKIVLSVLWLSLLSSVTDSHGQSRSQANEQARLVVQTGHSNGVNSVAFSSSGRTLASGSNDDSIRLWDVSSGTELRTLKGHSNSVSSVAFSADGKTLASGSWDATIKLWDVSSGTELFTLKGHSGFITSVAFNPDGKTLASGSMDDTIKLWDVAKGTELRTLKGHSSAVNSVAFSADGRMLASGSWDTTIKLWDLDRGTEERTLRGHSDSVTSVAFSPDGQLLATGSDDKTIKLWDVSGATELRTLNGHSGNVISVAFRSDGTSLASCGLDQRIKLWDVGSGTAVRTLTGHSASVNSVAFSPNGAILASGSDDRTIGLWDVTNGTELRTLKGTARKVESMAFSPDGRVLASGYFDGTITLWDVDTGRELHSLKGHLTFVSSLAFGADGKTLASGSWDATIKLWDVASGAELCTFKGHSSQVSLVAFSSNGKTLVSASWDTTIKLWDLSNGAELRTLKGKLSQVDSVALSPDGKSLASYGDNGSIKLFDLLSATDVRTLKAQSAGVSSVVFSPTGNTLASGSLDKTIKLWDVTNGIELRTLKGHSDSVFSMAFSSDGKTLASASHDRTIKLWDVVSGIELRTLNGHSNLVSSMEFSPDGKTLAIGTGDSDLKLWRVADGTELASLVALDDNDWAVVTPSGLFDASPGARKLMHYVVGMEVVTLDQMKDLYYVPGLLQKVMKGEALPKVQLFSAKDLFPEAEYQQPKPGQKTFTVKLRNRGGGIGPAQVLVNGTEVISDARPAGFYSQAKEVTLTIDLSNVKQIVSGKGNKVEVIARNAAGSLSSRGSARGTELVVVDGGQALTAAPELYAIVGGVGDYVDANLHLAYSAKDSADFARALEIGATRFLGRDKVHIRLLTTASAEAGGPNRQLGASGSTALSGSDSSVLDATKENFRKVFAEFAAKATTNDILVVYLSGHALALKLNQNPSNPGGDTYLYLTREAYTTRTEVLADEHVRTATTLSGDELLESIKHIAALKKALVLDTCAAGAAAESLIAHRGDATDTIKVRALENLKGTTGFFILMGSAGDKVSYEATPYRQGLLTYSLLEALKGAKLRDGGFADVGQVFGYAQNRVPEIARTLGLSQQPRFLAPDVGSPFDVGQYTAEEQRLFSLPNPNPLILRPSLQNRDLGYDNLKLMPVLNKALLEASYASGRGNGQAGSEQASLVFVDASEMLDAFTPSGLYTVNNNQVTIQLNLIRNEQLAATVTVQGPVTDEQSKATLIQKLVAAISLQLGSLRFTK